LSSETCAPRAAARLAVKSLANLTARRAVCITAKALVSTQFRVRSLARSTRNINSPAPAMTAKITARTTKAAIISCT
jgi:hypothetical protein